MRSSRSTADLLAVVYERISRAFNRSGATRAVALDVPKAFDRVWHAGLLHKLKSYGISGQIFGLISSFPSNRQLRKVLHGKSSKEYPVNAGVPHGSILGPTLFLLNIIGHLICGNNLNWFLNLNLVRSGLLISMLGKLSWFRLTGLIIMVLLM